MVPLGKPAPVEHQPDNHPQLWQPAEDAVEVEQPQQINEIREAAEAEDPASCASPGGSTWQKMCDRGTHTKAPITR